MDKKTLPRYKSSKYYAKFEADWIEENGGFIKEEERALILLFKNNGELTPESEVSMAKWISMASGYELSLNKQISVCWQRTTREGKEKIVLGTIKPDEDFFDFLNKFLTKWYGGYRKTSYYIMKAICKLYHNETAKFKEMAGKAKNLNEFIILMGLR